MNLKHFADSYDIIKKAMLQWLSRLGPWAVHPMFTHAVTDVEAAAFSDFLGARLVSSESLPTDSLVVGVSRLGEARLGGERVVPTESTVYGVSRYGQAKYGAEDNLYSALKGRLDSINGNRPNNVHDALIAETSIKGGHVFVTDDTDLAAVTKEYGGQCLSVAELLVHCTEGAAT